jgi:hypothetical protein
MILGDNKGSFSEAVGSIEVITLVPKHQCQCKPCDWINLTFSETGSLGVNSRLTPAVPSSSKSTYAYYDSKLSARDM